MVLFLFPIWGIGYLWYSFEKAEKGHFRAWYQNEFLPIQIRHEVYDIDTVNSKKYVITLNSIDSIPDPHFFRICKSCPFEIGDTIFKEKNKEELFLKDGNSLREVDYNFCSE